MDIKAKRRLPWYLLPSIFALAWPTMLEQIMSTAVQYIDTAMVGSLGTAATASVGATTTVSWLIGSTLHASAIGFLAYISQAYGAGEKHRAAKASSQAVLTVLVLGVFFTVLTLALSPIIPAWMQVEESIRPTASRYFFIIYTPMLARCATIIFGTALRAAGDTKTPMRVGITVNIVNILLNFILIYPTRTIDKFGVQFTVFGAGLGVIGAAIATAVSYACGGIIITLVLFWHKEISPRGYSIKPDMSVLGPCMRVAIPNAFQRFGTSLGYVAFAAMVNSLGGIATAAHTIANTVESAFYIPGYGMQTAAATLTGNAVGAKDEKRIGELAVMINIVEVAMMIVSGSALFIFAEPMMGLFSADAAVIMLGCTVLRMVAVSEPFYGVSIIVEGMLMGMGETTVPFACNIAGMWGIRIVGTFITTQLLGMGLASAWACMIAHNMVLFAMFGVYYLSGRWKKKMHN